MEILSELESVCVKVAEREARLREADAEAERDKESDCVLEAVRLKVVVADPVTDVDSVSEAEGLSVTEELAVRLWEELELVV